MKGLAFALVLLSLSPPAFAQHETIEVDGLETLSGLWKITFPAGASGYMPGRGRLYTARMESFCRLQQTGQNVSAICLPGWGPDSGSGELDGRTLHLAWGMALFRAVIDAKIENPPVRAFDGDFALKVFGIRHDAPSPALARKFVPDASAPDKGDEAPLLIRILGELAAGAIATPHVADVAQNFGHQMGANQANTPDEIRGLGRVEAVVYLGEGSAPHGRVSDVDMTHLAVSVPGFAFSAYQVEFAHGQRLCGIHQRADGVLDGFLCV